MGITGTSAADIDMARATRRSLSQGIARRLKELRAQRASSAPKAEVTVEKDGVARWQQQYAAKLVGVDPAKWNKWEHGTNVPDTFSLIRIIQAFGVTADWLLQGPPKKT
jgi:transcriptional regulator with XRE-family HTH domain